MSFPKPWNFLNAYTRPNFNGYAWEYEGSSERAETELKKRLSLIMISHDRATIWASTPPKTRQVIRLDVGVKDDTKEMNKLRKAQDERSIYKQLEKTLDLKIDAIVENVIDGLGSGEKCIVWVLSRESVEIVTSAIEKATESRSHAPLMRTKRVRIWATHGEADVKARNRVAGEFRDHPGAGVIIATMDSMPESISLFGATTEHYAQLHYNPGPMVQSENRPYLKDTSKLHIIYYIAQKTIDERMEKIVLPRVEAMAAIIGEKDAASISSALTADKKEESLKDMFARLFAGGPDEEGSIDFGCADLDVDGGD